MKSKQRNPATIRRVPTEAEIRDYALHLYHQSGCQPGHDLDNWLEAKACLEASIPKSHSRTRLHRHRTTLPISAIAGVVLHAPEEDLGGDTAAFVVEDVVVPAPPRKPRS